MIWGTRSAASKVSRVSELLEISKGLSQNTPLIPRGFSGEWSCVSSNQENSFLGVPPHVLSRLGNVGLDSTEIASRICRGEGPNPFRQRGEIFTTTIRRPACPSAGNGMSPSTPLLSRRGEPTPHSLKNNHLRMPENPGDRRYSKGLR